MINALLMIARLIGRAHDAWRAKATRRRPLAAEVDSLQERLERLRAENELLRARLLRLDGHARPLYRSWERLAILWHAARYGLSLKAVARAFVLAEQTILNWKKELRSGVARLVQARPPLNRLPELVEHLVRRLKREWPRWGSRRIAGILGRLGVKASRSTIQRMLRRPPRRRPKAGAPRAGGRPLRARRPGHVVLVDFTRVSGFFRSIVVGVVIDAFSRKILALRVSPGEPRAAFACRLMSEAAKHRRPRWVITDRGWQFTSRGFRRFLARREIRQRFGAVGRSQPLAIIDRFFRSLKEEYARGLLLYRPIRSIERDLRRYAFWFNSERSHEGLSGRTPDEVHFDRPKRPLREVERGILSVSYLAGDRHLPVLRLRAA